MLHGDAFSNIWFHGITPSSIVISASNTFVPITSFDQIGEEDDLGNVIANTTNNDLTIGANAAGNYDATFHMSATSSGASSEFIVVVGQTFATPLNITVATNATPIVITSAGHGLRKGDMITVAGATGNTGANGDWFLSAVTTDTMTLVNLQGVNSVGNGVYDADSGDVTIAYHGNLILHRDISQTDIGSGGANADLRLVASDKIKLYTANIGATRDLDIVIVNLKIERIGD